MLFVDDDESEAGEVDGVLDERVGADHQIHRAIGQTGQHISTLGAGDAIGQQFDAQGPVAEEVLAVGDGDAPKQSPDPLVVLFGEHLGGRHERALVPTLDGDQEGGHRHHRLAGPDIALEESVHRVTRGEIGVDLGERPLLGAGQREREGIVEAADEGTAEVMDDATGRPFQLALAGDEYRLDPEQFVEGESTTGGVLGPHRLRLMDGADRLRAVDEVESVEDLLGHRVGDTALGAATQGLLDPSGDLPGGEAGLLALRVDRHDPSGAVADEIDDRIRHLTTAGVLVDATEEGDLHTGGELTGSPGLVEEDERDLAGLVADDDRHHGPPVAGGAGVHRADLGDHECLLADREGGDRRLVGPVDPSPRVGGEEIEHGLDADGSERRPPLLAHPVQAADVDLREVAERDRSGGPVAHSAPNRYG